VGTASSEFFVEGVLPFAGVCALIAGLTATLFDVPMSAPPRPAEVTPLPPTSRATQAQMNDVLSRAMRTLNQGRLPRPEAPGVSPAATPSGAAISFPVPVRPAAPGAASPAPPAPLPLPEPAATATADPGLFAAVSALSEAVKAVREVRTEEDLTRAEETMKTARERMEAACKSGASPLCEGAAQMKSLGY
jgi:hypothetical protein